MRAFTLVEVLVVMMLLAVVAGLIAPRLRSSDIKRGQARAEAIASLFETAARRQEMSGRLGVVTFARDGETGEAEFALTSRRTTLGRIGFERDTQATRDRLVAPVDLAPLSIEAITIGGRPVEDSDAWRVVFDPIGIRPEVELIVSLADRTDGPRWRVSVPERGAVVRAALVPEIEGERILPAQTLDLDQIGLTESRW